MRRPTETAVLTHPHTDISAPAVISFVDSSAAAAEDDGAAAPSTGGPHSEVLAGFFAGQAVHVWSNSSTMWFDGVVDGVATSAVKEKFQDQDRKVPPGSIKVRFDGKIKWLPIAQAEDELRKIDGGGEDLARYGWREMRPHDTVPDRAVRSGTTKTDGEVFVARDPQGEPGKLSLEAAEEGRRRMGRIWCPGGDGVERGEALVLRPRHVARWVPVSRGDQLPAGAVPARAAPEGQQVYVARSGEEAGRLSAADGRVEEVRCHHAGSSASGDVLVVEEVARELEVEVLKAMSLQGPGYRMFDGLRKGVHWMKGTSSMSPYISVAFGDDQKWRSTCRMQADGEVFFGERAYFPLPASEPLPSCLKFKAKDERLLRQMVGMRGDPTIGTASLEMGQLDSTEVQTLELMRGGNSQGRLTVRLRWHGGFPGAP